MRQATWLDPLDPANYGPTSHHSEQMLMAGYRNMRGQVPSAPLILEQLQRDLAARTLEEEALEAARAEAEAVAFEVLG